ncbi:MAG: LysM peptidoglycan-binding domain-containing protein [Candidatus Nitronauta litoralis]|uniref:LysM peptidoglycan-binding domain-containing protein n=1 Tax=Candidatus Nitronauta litoralis TaxID=2705533 RepID=A0A7T0BZE7_9BACT|nr:MAG: LysM peptidoglycan-binding domain-containing protein [Candidatus Nitronauta litoralis]
MLLRLKAPFTLIAFVCFLLISVTSGWSKGTSLHSGQKGFTTPRGLESAVGFWTKVYTEYTTRHAILHDSEDLSVIYEVVYLGEKRLGHRRRSAKVNPVRRKYQKILRKLAKRKGTLGLTSEERRVAKLVKGSYSRAARKIRVQIGQKDRFREGIVRSGKYLEGIQREFRLHRMPEELTVLPHVESSFQVNAYSSAGAAGVWQFTRSTGRLFMKVGYSVDERRDPILSANAAARLLKSNYDELGSWPLAITAYNHGVNGMKRAQRRYGNDIVKIIKRYKSRTFGFASRNFYAEFLAALGIIKNYKKYFPKVVMDKPIKTVSTRLKYFIHIDDLVKNLGMTKGEIAEFNPALREPVISGKKRIPKNFLLKAPASKVSNLGTKIASLPSSHRFSKQVRSRWYTVRRGDTLSSIARRMRTSVRALKVSNNIDNQHRIYKGQVLEMPWGAKAVRKSQTVKVASVKSRKPQLYLSDNLKNYRVKRHDNLSKIARRFDMSVKDLIRVNRLRNPDRLKPGQTIKVASLQSAGLVKPERKLSIKTKQPKKADDKLVASVAPMQAEGSGKIKIEYSDAISTTKHFNKNRPAFMPVKFSGGSHKNGKVGIIAVDFEETLSHYADWAGISIAEFRKFNKLGRRASLQINQSLRVPLYKKTAQDFEEKRQEYHRAIQEDFFNNYRVEKVVIRNLKRGETIWEICNDIYVIPMWLLSNYNQEKNINALAEGAPVVIPVITAIKA